MRSLLVLWVLAAAARGQAPALTHLHPVSGQQGTKVTVSAAGKLGTWPPQVWVEGEGVTFYPGPKAPIFEVEIAPGAAPGARLVRFYNEKGASVARVFIVSADRQVLDVEPNDRANAPQAVVPLPVVVAGKLEKGQDVDSYAVPLKRGQTLVAWLEAYVLASTFDGILRVTDAQGTQLAYNHDGRTLDPFLAWTAPADGTYSVQVMGFVYPATSGVTFTSGEGCVYRLHLTSGPFVHHTLPLALPRARPVPEKLIGWNVPAGDFPLEKAQVERAIPLSDLPEAVESEPHAALSVPGAVTGHLLRGGEEDRYIFTAVKGKLYEVAVTAAAFGSPLDAWLKIEDAKGKELVRSDDAPVSRDPLLLWTAPADGAFTLVLGDLTHQGGTDFFYRIALQEAVPAAEGSVAASAFTLEAGKTLVVKVACKRRHQLKAKLQVEARGLPEGVTAKAVEVPAKDGEVTVKLVATAEAARANQPFQLVIRETEGTQEWPVRQVLTTAEIGAVPSGYTTLLRPEVVDLWITVTGK